MKQIVLIIQIILGVILASLIMLQAKGTGLGSTFGSNLSFYSTRRGAEKLIFILTIIIAAAFIITSLVGVII